MEMDTVSKLRRLIVARVIFACLLLFSTSLSFRNASVHPFEPPLLWLYGLIFSLVLLSLIYFLYMRIAPVAWVGAFVQICLDSVAVTAIVYLTGGVGSVFTFLYLIVIIYAGIILYRHGSLAITLCCGIQYAALIGLQYFDLTSYRLGIDPINVSSYGSVQTIYKAAVTILAFLAVALLSSFLAEQNRKSKSKLNVMAERVRRVEKLAAMGEMAAGLAHEIKNPLAAMTGSIQLLQEELPADPGRDQLMGIVMREADRLTSLINDFLLFARPPAGRVE
ncbi:MAG: histidine kinase dimerization/phospho-acceptor domain-containing protein, partial [Desulfobacterales bacterium]